MCVCSQTPSPKHYNHTTTEIGIPAPTFPPLPPPPLNYQPPPPFSPSSSPHPPFPALSPPIITALASPPLPSLPSTTDVITVVYCRHPPIITAAATTITIITAKIVERIHLPPFWSQV